VLGLEMSMGWEGSIGLGGAATDAECSLSEVITIMSWLVLARAGRP
jgi:hypothetical protein